MQPQKIPIHYGCFTERVKGKCRKKLKDGTICGREFEGTRMQIYCAEHAYSKRYKQYSE